MKIKNTFRNLGLILISLLAALLMAEAALRLYDRQARHFQGARVDGELRNPSSKILILGDSFLTPAGTGQTFYEVLERELRSSRVQLLNTAKPGFGPADYWIQIQAFAPSFKPDTVFLFYYTGNDLTNVQYRLNRFFWIKLWMNPLLNQMEIFNLLNEARNRMTNARAQHGGKSKSPAGEPAASAPGNGQIHPYFLELSAEKPHYVMDNLLMETDQNKRSWEIGKQLLAKIDAYCRKRNIRLFLIALPSMAQVDRQYFPFYERAHFDMDPRTLTSSAPQDALRSFCQSRQIRFFDLLPFFRQEKESHFYPANDDHFNFEGARFAAQKTIDFLKREFLTKG